MVRIILEKKRMPHLVVLLVMILLALGWSGYVAINKASELTSQLYDHPYVVSTAILRINANVIRMHQSMKELLVATTPEEMSIQRKSIDQNEEQVLTDFELVEDRFLGDPRMVHDALQTFLAWKPIREQIITLALQGQAEQATSINKNENAKQMKEVDKKMNDLLDFAKYKARLFYVDAQETKTKISHVMLMVFGVALLLSAMILRRVVWLEGRWLENNEKLESKVQERTNDLSAANEEMNALNEEVRAMNDELMTVNEKLEMRVEERTAELVASYQELKATEEELRTQFENLQDTQEALRREKLLTDALFNSVPGMLYLYDDQGKLLRWNKKHEEMTGYSSEELLGVDVLTWYKGDKATIGHVLKSIERAMKDGFADTEAELQRKDGSKIVAYLTAVPLEIEGKMHFAGIGLDIAERKQAREKMVVALKKAEEANLAKSQFLANMSHEIRTPMNGIIGMTDLTLLTDLEDKQREYLTIVRSSTISLLRVLNDILDYSKIEAGKIELEKLPFDLQNTINDVVDLFDIGAKQKGLRIVVKMNEDVPNDIIGDSVRFRQVLSNLVGNGIKFTYQGEIFIHAAVETRTLSEVKLKFTVTDTGVGIPEDKLDKLFKRFSQVDDSNTRQFGGTGLGLAISKKLIEIMDGDIGVESVETVGSSFFFTAVFGIQEVEQQKEDISDNGPILCEHNKIKKVLLAEDDLVSRNMVTIMLKAKGFKVVAVENGKEAISAFEKTKFDVILMDINMPYLDGYSATSIIREKEQNSLSPTPIIAMTAYALKGDRDKCLAAGMNDYISKPIDLNQVMDIIQKYVTSRNDESNRQKDAAEEATNEIVFE